MLFVHVFVLHFWYNNLDLIKSVPKDYESTVHISPSLNTITQIKTQKQTCIQSHTNKLNIHMNTYTPHTHKLKLEQNFKNDE